jgi:hypothetical protein
MPLGFQERFTYSDRRSSCEGVAAGTFWSFSGTPLIGYEAVYGYRSGKRAQEMSTKGSYASSVRGGRDLVSSLIARKKYLEDFIRDSFEPQVGSPSVFSTTDVGHPFATFKVSTQSPYARVRYKSGLDVHNWDVTVAPLGLPYPNIQDPFGVSVRTDNSAAPMGHHTYFTWPTHLLAGGLNAPSSQQMIPLTLKNAVGTGLIASTNPYTAKADVAVTVLELLTGNLPRVLGRIGDHLTRLSIDWKLQTGKTLSKHTNPGNEWLSYHFGWAPLVRDVIAATETLLKLHLLLFGASDESRRHRGGDLATTSRMATSFTAAQRSWNIGSPLAATTGSPYMRDVEGFASVAPGAPDNTQAVWSKTVRLVSDYRFSARFHAGARENGQQAGFLDRALELLGADITPATLWNLAPWTWLLDWFTNLGTVTQNLSDLDWSNVLLDYAYLTLQVKAVASMSVTLPPSWSAGRMTSTHSTIAHYVTSVEKVREQASPVGFSVSWDGLSPFQLSILAALGMTRGR